MSYIKKLVRIALVLLISGLAACGGGSGSSTGYPSGYTPGGTTTGGTTTGGTTTGGTTTGDTLTATPPLSSIYGLANDSATESTGCNAGYSYQRGAIPGGVRDAAGNAAAGVFFCYTSGSGNAGDTALWSIKFPDGTYSTIQNWAPSVTDVAFSRSAGTITFTATPVTITNYVSPPVSGTVSGTIHVTPW